MMKTDDKLATEMSKIHEKIKKLRKEYGNKFEYVFFLTQYTNNGEFVSGIHESYIQSVVNHDIYSEFLMRSKFNRTELIRFKEYMRLGKFRVFCKNASVTPEFKKELKSNSGNWLKEGEVYIVTKTIISKLDGSLCFELTDKNGIKMNIIKPYCGYGSDRFDPIDYSRLN